MPLQLNIEEAIYKSLLKTSTSLQLFKPICFEQLMIQQLMIKKEVNNMSASTTGRSGVRVGKAPSAKSEGGAFWNAKEGETYELTLLCEPDAIVSVDQVALWDISPAPIWVSIGSTDPSRELGVKPTYRAFMPVLVNGDAEIKIWSMPVSVHRDLVEIATMSDGLVGMIVKFKRTGSGKTTKYTVVGTPKRGKSLPKSVPTVDDIISRLGPETREEIIEMIEERAGMEYSAVVKMYQTKNGVKPGEIADETVEDL